MSDDSFSDSIIEEMVAYYEAKNTDKVAVEKFDKEIQTVALQDENNFNVIPGYVEITQDILKYENTLEILKNWVLSAPVPDENDIAIFIISASTQINSKLYESIYNAMLYLCRLINIYRNDTQYCGWHRTYNSLVSDLKEMMMGEPLPYRDKLKCTACIEEWEGET